MDETQQAPGASSSEAKLAFVEGFLIGLARRLDDASYSWPESGEAANNCRAVAAMVRQVGVPMDRAKPAEAK